MVHIWDVAKNTTVKGFSVNALQAMDIQNGYLAACGRTGEMKILDLEVQAELLRAQIAKLWIHQIKISPQRNVVALQTHSTYSEVNAVFFVDLRSGTEAVPMHRDADLACCESGLAFSSDGNTLSFMSGKTPCTIDMRTRKPVPNGLISAGTWQSLFFIGNTLCGIKKEVNPENMDFRLVLMSGEMVGSDPEHKTKPVSLTAPLVIWHSATQELLYCSTQRYGVCDGSVLYAKTSNKNTDDYRIALFNSVYKPLNESVCAEKNKFYQNVRDTNQEVILSIVHNDDLFTKNGIEAFKDKIKDGLLKDFPTCLICALVYSNFLKVGGAGEEFTTKCGHKLCLICYDRIFNGKNPKCPQCRAEL
jgi:Zinc finger, C3HC4 type (RING finger)